MADIDFILRLIKKIELHAYRDLLDMIKEHIPEVCEKCKKTINEYFDTLEKHFQKMLANKLYRHLTNESAKKN